MLVSYVSCTWPTPPPNQAPPNQAPPNLAPPAQDLDSITTSYSGYARILRLVYVAYRCPNMCRPALRLAIRYVQADTVNVRMYNRLLQRYQLLPVDGLVTVTQTPVYVPAMNHNRIVLYEE